jgi:hypothetical protein
VQSEGLGKLKKKSFISSGLEPVGFQLVGDEMHSPEDIASEKIPLFKEAQ